MQPYTGESWGGVDLRARILMVYDSTCLFGWRERVLRDPLVGQQEKGHRSRIRAAGQSADDRAGREGPIPVGAASHGD